jgi:hypothetical protein
MLASAKIAVREAKKRLLQRFLIEFSFLESAFIPSIDIQRR